MLLPIRRAEFATSLMAYLTNVLGVNATVIHSCDITKFSDYAKIKKSDLPAIQQLCDR